MPSQLHIWNLYIWMPVLVEIVFNKNNCTVGQFFASASLIMDSLCIFVITTQCVFQCVANYFSCISNYFFY